MNLFHFHRPAFAGFIIFLFVFAFQDCDKKKNNSANSSTNNQNSRVSDSSSNTTTTNELTNNLRINEEIPLFGVTIDSIENIGDTADSLRILRAIRKPTVRVVFDPDKNADYYKPALDRLKGDGNDVMGLIADSSAMHVYKNTEDFKARTEQYMQTMGAAVDIWEIGNEVNGEWVGYPRLENESDGDFEKRLERELPQKKYEELDAIRKRTAAQITEAFRVVDGKSKETALTLYYNDENIDGKAVKCDYPTNYCWTDLCRNKVLEGQDYGMLNWVRKYLTDGELRNNLKYVFISFYEDDCKILSRNVERDVAKWVEIFKELSVIFPNAKLGFGEFGPQCKSCKDERNCRKCLNDQKEFIGRYYKTYDAKLKAQVSKYVGGYFYWYFKQDMVPKEKESLRTLANTIK